MPAVRLDVLAAVEQGHLDCFVIYKLDRLSRSVRDYLNLLAFLEEHKVAFVSVTQQFNTTNSLGRLTLNPLAHLDPMGALLLLVAWRIGEYALKLGARGAETLSAAVDVHDPRFCRRLVRGGSLGAVEYGLEVETRAEGRAVAAQDQDFVGHVSQYRCGSAPGAKKGPPTGP